MITTAFPHRRRNPLAVLWTRDECARLEHDGYLSYRYELVEGEIIRKMPQNIPHRTAVVLLITWLVSVFGPHFVQTQAAIDVAPEDNPTSEPEPDAAVLSIPLPSIAASGSRNPSSTQVLLAVEVSDTTLDYDLEVKAGLYARAGLLEYWVIDLNGRSLHCHRAPVAGQYRQVTTHSAQEAISPLAAPNQPISVAALLP